MSSTSTATITEQSSPTPETSDGPDIDKASTYESSSFQDIKTESSEPSAPTPGTETTSVTPVTGLDSAAPPPLKTEIPIGEESSLSGDGETTGLWLPSTPIETPETSCSTMPLEKVTTTTSDSDGNETSTSTPIGSPVITTTTTTNISSTAATPALSSSSSSSLSARPSSKKPTATRTSKTPTGKTAVPTTNPTPSFLPAAVWQTATPSTLSTSMSSGSAKGKILYSTVLSGSKEKKSAPQVQIISTSPSLRPTSYPFNPILFDANGIPIRPVRDPSAGIRYCAVCNKEINITIRDRYQTFGSRLRELDGIADATVGKALSFVFGYRTKEGTPGHVCNKCYNVLRMAYRSLIKLRDGVSPESLIGQHLAPVKYATGTTANTVNLPINSLVGGGGAGGITSATPTASTSSLPKPVLGGASSSSSNTSTTSNQTKSTILATPSSSLFIANMVRPFPTFVTTQDASVQTSTGQTVSASSITSPIRGYYYNQGNLAVFFNVINRILKEELTELGRNTKLSDKPTKDELLPSDNELCDEMKKYAPTAYSIFKALFGTRKVIGMPDNLFTPKMRLALGLAITTYNADCNRIQKAHGVQLWRLQHMSGDTCRMLFTLGITTSFHTLTKCLDSFTDQRQMAVWQQETAESILKEDQKLKSKSTKSTNKESTDPSPSKPTDVKETETSPSNNSLHFMAEAEYEEEVEVETSAIQFNKIEVQDVQEDDDDDIEFVDLEAEEESASQNQQKHCATPKRKVPPASEDQEEELLDLDEGFSSLNPPKPSTNSQNKIVVTTGKAVPPSTAPLPLPVLPKSTYRAPPIINLAPLPATYDEASLAKRRKLDNDGVVESNTRVGKKKGKYVNLSGSISIPTAPTKTTQAQPLPSTSSGLKASKLTPSPQTTNMYNGLCFTFMSLSAEKRYVHGLDATLTSKAKKQKTNVISLVGVFNRVPQVKDELFQPFTPPSASELPSTTFLLTPDDFERIRADHKTMIKKILIETISVFDGIKIETEKHKYYEESCQLSKTINLGLLPEDEMTQGGLKIALNHMFTYLPKGKNGATHPLLAFGDGVTSDRATLLAKCPSDAKTEKLKSIIPGPSAWHKRMRILLDDVGFFWNRETREPKSKIPVGIGTLGYVRNKYFPQATKTGLRPYAYQISKTFKFSLYSYITALAVQTILQDEISKTSKDIINELQYLSKEENCVVLDGIADKLLEFEWAKSMEKNYFEERARLCLCAEADMDTSEVINERQWIKCRNLDCPSYYWYHKPCIKEIVKTFGLKTPLKPPPKKGGSHRRPYLKNWFCSDECQSVCSDSILAYSKALIYSGLNAECYQAAIKENDAERQKLYSKLHLVQLYNRKHSTVFRIWHRSLALMSGLAPPHIQHDLQWNTTVNLVGAASANMEIDLYNEFVNRVWKKYFMYDVRTNTSKEYLQRKSQLFDIEKTIREEMKIFCFQSYTAPTPSSSSGGGGSNSEEYDKWMTDLNEYVQILLQNHILIQSPDGKPRAHPGYGSFRYDSTHVGNLGKYHEAIKKRCYELDHGILPDENEKEDEDEEDEEDKEADQDQETEAEDEEDENIRYMFPDGVDGDDNNNDSDDQDDGDNDSDPDYSE